jgi:Holliday junction resolvase RusA-like endonuclease
MALNDWEMLPAQTPLTIDIEIISRDGHRSDLDNQIKTLMDSAQNIVFPDDRWVDSITARRQKGERYEARVRVESLDTGDGVQREGA